VSDIKEKILSLWLAGHKIQAIAYYTQCAKSTVQNHLNQMQVPHRVTGAKSQNVWPSIVQWAKSGYTAEEITEALNFRGLSKQIALETPCQLDHQ
jgi:DNA-binding CsgD family transcriptional regulator